MMTTLLTLAADFGTSEVRVHANRHVQGPAAWQALEGTVETIKAAGPEPLRRELELFLDAVTRRERPAVDVEAGLLALRTVEAAQRSSELGRRVTLAERPRLNDRGGPCPSSTTGSPPWRVPLS